MIATLIAREQRLEDAVAEELARQPELEAALVDVSVRDGVVTLTGCVDCYPAKLVAERVARRVKGVTRVANELEVSA